MASDDLDARVWLTAAGLDALNLHRAVLGHPPVRCPLPSAAKSRTSDAPGNRDAWGGGRHG